jgi:beta-carotene hydroxylase
LLLRHRQDLQSVAYALAVPGLALWQWQQGWHPLAYAMMLLLWVGLGVVHHNHAHLPVWRVARLNRFSELWLGTLQGHATDAFRAAHQLNHHRHCQGPADVARTWRFGGDHNHLWGYVLHPFQAAWVLVPLLAHRLHQLRQRRPRLWFWVLCQWASVASLWGVALAVDPIKALLYLLLPQAIAMHWLLATNYLQHARTDWRSPWDRARNFEGYINHLFFNIGLHTAHHLQGRRHWSELPALHAQIRHRIAPQLLEPSLLGYMGRVYGLSLLHARWRSQREAH